MLYTVRQVVRDEKCIQNFGLQSEHLSLDGKIILKCILNKVSWMV
jgi:hypothetical protein